ncbi:MAG: T9SS type A sorting domain-containing protein [Bacteroidota bacterium]
MNGSISVTNSSYITISNLTMSGALSLNNNDHTYFSNATVTGTTLATDYGGTMNELYRVGASNIGASFGLVAYAGTGDLIESSISNGDCAVYLTNNASYNIGTNNTFCTNGIDIDAENGAYAYAISNTYSAPLPSTIRGNVFVTGQNGVCSQPKILLANNNAIQQVPSGLRALDEQYLALLRKIHDDKVANRYDAKKYVQDYQQLIDGYKSLINDGNDKNLIKAALSKLSHLYKGIGDISGFRNYVVQTLASAKLRHAESYLKRYFIWDYVDSKEYENSLKVADEVLSSRDAQEDLMAEMLYEKGLIYKYYQNSIEKANGVFASLMDKYPSSPLVAFAKVEMSPSPGYASKKIAVDISQPLEPIELSNYPNPFNPTTTISYELPSKSFITLKVYDVLGREVKTLVSGYQEAGSHSVQFNGENLPSGVYLYRLTAPGVVQVRKMLMTK